MTPELAAQLVERGIAPELTRLYTVLRAAYSDYTAEQIAAVFALIRAEIEVAKTQSNTQDSGRNGKIHKKSES